MYQDPVLGSSITLLVLLGLLRVVVQLELEKNKKKKKRVKVGR